MSGRSAARDDPVPQAGSIAGLLGAGPSKVSISAAMRARDVSRGDQSDELSGPAGEGAHYEAVSGNGGSTPECS